jgi:hypothetical protein
LPKPTAEFHIAYFFAQLGADTRPRFSPGGGTLRGHAIIRLFLAPQNAAPLAHLNFLPRQKHHAAGRDKRSIAKKPERQISKIF